MSRNSTTRKTFKKVCHLGESNPGCSVCRGDAFSFVPISVYRVIL